MPGHVNSPVLYQSRVQMPLSPKGSLIQSFRFQTRRDGIDWRRFSAIDVDRVARELDISTLQDSISSITFCNLDSERCPYCQQPVDPVLLKVLKMAQFIIEYLLHCQECLSSNIALLEERIEEAVLEQQKTKEELIKQGEELKKIKEESKRRKKLISTQQMLLQAGANNYHKCQQCDKSFMNYSYLQGHIQRRHPEITETERQKKKQVEQMEVGIEDLKSRLQNTQFQLEAEREMENRRRMQELEEARLREENLKRDFERWKEEEKIKIQDEMEKMRQQFLSQIEDITLKNSTIENRFKDLINQKTVTSNLGDLMDEEDRRERQKMQQELRILRDDLERQQSEWKGTLKETRKEHSMEKKELINENKRLKASMSSDQRIANQQFEVQMETLMSKIEAQKNLIKSQEKKIKELTTFREVPQVVLPVGGAKDESSEEETDESPDLRNIEALRRDPGFIRQFRPILEEALIEKLESMGVKKGAKGVSPPMYKTLKALLATQMQQKVNRYPEIEAIKAKLGKVLTRRVKQWRKNEDTLQTNSSKLTSQNSKSFQRQYVKEKGVHPVEQVNPQPKNMVIVESRQPPTKAPVPSPRRKVMGQQNESRITNVAAPFSPRTPPFTSEDDYSVMDHSSFHTPKHKSTPESLTTPRLQKQTEVYSDEDSSFDSDTSLEKPSPRSVTFSTEMSNQGSLVQSMARSLERQLSKPRQKPVGGVETVTSKPMKSINTPKKTEEMHLSDLSDSEISSFDEITENLGTGDRKPQPILRQSADSTGSRSTSVWSSDSIRAGGW
ncbi:cilium assembly protein DZIP1L [Spea bombifrons]|uniref:cilium assembly protein DZIP1L n=1 Tax=Spea bombifrons TaxID=233779 RepID=UPI00234ABBBC|nr:cilium assembly protein DZIP1L [Spea bombifrons]